MLRRWMESDNLWKRAVVMVIILCPWMLGAGMLMVYLIILPLLALLK